MRIQRLKLVYCFLSPDEDGELVRYVDIEQLQAENERLNELVYAYESVRAPINPLHAANQQLRDALQKIHDARIANMKPNSVALYQMFVKETAEQALKEVADFEQRPEARNLYGVRAVIEQLQPEPDQLKAEKGMVDMGFVSKGADAKTERLQAELDKLRWIPVSEMPEHLAARIELLTHRGWVDCGVKDAYGKGFNIGTGRLYFSAGYYTHYREVILPEQAPKESNE